jgi:hypothetical protein
MWMLFLGLTWLLLAPVTALLLARVIQDADERADDTWAAFCKAHGLENHAWRGDHVEA